MERLIDLPAVPMGLGEQGELIRPVEYCACGLIGMQPLVELGNANSTLPLDGEPPASDERADRQKERKARLLSRDRQSSEQFAGLNRRYDEKQAECALVPLTISDTSQEEAL